MNSADPVVSGEHPGTRKIGGGDNSVSTKTGAFSYAYPIEVPQGRLGMAPSLALSYSSRGQLYGDIAAGWSLNIPAIEIDRTQSRLAAKSEGDRFIGPTGRLIHVVEPSRSDVVQTYRAQYDASYVRYGLMDDSVARFRWRARNTDGSVSYFGDASHLLANFRTQCFPQLGELGADYTASGPIREHRQLLLDQKRPNLV